MVAWLDFYFWLLVFLNGWNIYTYIYNKKSRNILIKNSQNKNLLNSNYLIYLFGWQLRCILPRGVLIKRCLKQIYRTGLSKFMGENICESVIPIKLNTLKCIFSERLFIRTILWTTFELRGGSKNPLSIFPNYGYIQTRNN